MVGSQYKLSRNCSELKDFIPQNEYNYNNQLTAGITANGVIASIVQYASPNVTVAGIDASVNATNDTVNFKANATGNVDGTGDTVNLPKANYVGIDGTGATVNATTNDSSVGFFPNSSANINGRNITVGLNYSSDLCWSTGGQSSIGGIDTINAASEAQIGAAGNTWFNVVGSGNNPITFNSSAYCGVIGGTGDVINNAGGCTIESTNGSSWNQYGSDVTDVLGNNCYIGVMAGSTGVTIQRYWRQFWMST